MFAILNYGKKYIDGNKTHVYVDVKPYDDITHMNLSGNNVEWSGWETFKSSFTFDFTKFTPTSDSSLTIYIQLKQSDGTVHNISQSIEHDISIEKRPQYLERTQSIVNAYPGWNENRNNRKSDGYKIFNSFGKEIDNLESRLDYSSNSTCLDTITANHPDVVRKIKSKLLKADPNHLNKLINSNFSDVRNGRPIGWYGDISVNESLKTNTVQIDSELEETRIFSTSLIHVSKTKKLHLHGLYKTDMDEVIEGNEEAYFGFTLICIGQDNKVSYSYAPIDTFTNASWNYFDVEFDIDIYPLRMILVFELYRDVSFDFHGSVLFDNLCLTASKTGAWKPSVFNLFEKSGDLYSADILSPNVSIHSAFHDWWHNANPTRIDASSRFASSTTKPDAFYVDEVHTPMRDSVLCAWNVVDGHIERLSQDVSDNYGIFYLAVADGNKYINVDEDIEAATVEFDKLWAITEPDDNGIRKLYVGNLSISFPYDGHLMADIVFNLSDDPSDNINIDTIKFIEFQNEDPQWLYVHSDDYTYPIRLYYDHAYIHRATGEVFFREHYDQAYLVQGD